MVILQAYSLIIHGSFDPDFCLIDMKVDIFSRLPNITDISRTKTLVFTYLMLQGSIDKSEDAAWDALRHTSHLKLGGVQCHRQLDTSP